MATPSPYNFSKNAEDESDLDPTKNKPAGAGSLTTSGGGAQPSTPTPASPAGTASGQTGQKQMYPGAVDPQMKGGMMRTANGSTIGQSPMNPSSQYISTPKQTFNYATSPGTGNADFAEVLHPKQLAEIGMKNFGDNSLANRAARPVGRSMKDPERRMEMAERDAVANNDMQGAAQMAAMRMGQKQQMAGGMMRTPNGSTIGQSPMNLSGGQSNTPSQTLNYATRPGTGNTNFDAVNHPDPKTFGDNSLANRAARPVGRSMKDHPERRIEMAERAAVANNDVQGAAQMARMRLQGRAKGGPVQAGKPYLVGEKGPEIIVPKQSGTVVPNHAISMAELMEMKRAGKNIVLPKGAVGAKFFESRLVPQKKACRGRG